MAATAYSHQVSIVEVDFASQNVNQPIERQRKACTAVASCIHGLSC